MASSNHTKLQTKKCHETRWNYPTIIGTRLWKDWVQQPSYPQDLMRSPTCPYNGYKGKRGNTQWLTARNLLIYKDNYRLYTEKMILYYYYYL